MRQPRRLIQVNDLIEELVSVRAVRGPATINARLVTDAGATPFAGQN
jgi:hypothetical protein